MADLKTFDELLQGIVQPIREHVAVLAQERDVHQANAAQAVANYERREEEHRTEIARLEERVNELSKQLTEAVHGKTE